MPEPRSRTTAPPLRLQFDPREIKSLAGRYDYENDAFIVHGIGPAARERGYYSRQELIEVCAWKTPRSKPLVKRNTETDVIETTRLALSAKTDALSIWIPMALDGVSWPTSSVLLHFAHAERYPIIDYRALESFGVIRGTVNYSFDLWQRYVSACRKLADETGLDMRTLDQGLWQWSRENGSE